MLMRTASVRTYHTVPPPFGTSLPWAFTTLGVSAVTTTTQSPGNERTHPTTSPACIRTFRAHSRGCGE